MPKYSVKQWDIELQVVFYDGLVPNYLFCNLHKILYYISSICFYNNFIIPNFEEPEDSDVFLNLNDFITEFIRTISTSNSVSGLKMKYLKYKTKYLKLKQNI
jgi:hypothetical protein